MLPELYNAENMLCPVEEDEILACEEETTHRQPISCDDTISELCTMMMAESGLQKPSGPIEAKNLYMHLRQKIHTDLIAARE